MALFVLSVVLGMADQAFNFQTLNPDIIIDALFEQGIRVDSGLTPLNSYENRVYQFQDEESGRYVVKFYRPHRWTSAQIEEEHRFSIELDMDDIPVAAPVCLHNETLLQSNGFCFSVFRSLGGRQFEPDNFEQMEWVGRYLGRIHQVGLRQRFEHRPDIGIQEYLLEPRALFESTSLIPSTQKRKFLSACDQLIEGVIAQWHTHFSYLRLHGDCHPGNILWRDGPLFVDFDDARNGPAIQDLWMLLNGSRTEQRIQMEIILEAYEEFSRFNIEELRLIEPLRAMRLVHYLAWLIRRWGDPAFPRSFPWFNEEDYWRKQSAIFIEQFKVLQEPPLQLTPMY